MAMIKLSICRKSYSDSSLLGSNWMTSVTRVGGGGTTYVQHPVSFERQANKRAACLVKMKWSIIEKCYNRGIRMGHIRGNKESRLNVQLEKGENEGH